MNIARLFAYTLEIEKRAVDAEAREKQTVRDYQDRLTRSEIAQAIEISRLQGQIGYLEQLNERLLRLAGVDPLAAPNAIPPVDPVDQTPSSSERRSSSSAELIARDKQQTFAAQQEAAQQAFLVWQAEQAKQERAKGDSPDS